MCKRVSDTEAQPDVNRWSLTDQDSSEMNGNDVSIAIQATPQPNEPTGQSLSMRP